MQHPNEKNSPIIHDREPRFSFASSLPSYSAETHEQIDRQQGLYLTASGTLTQFNAIMAAVQTMTFSMVQSETSRLLIGMALFLHVWAAFLLCWAARPTNSCGSELRLKWRANLPAELLARADQGEQLAMKEIIDKIDAIEAMRKPLERRLALDDARGIVDDTLQNYRRGWRATMFAICISMIALLTILVLVPGFVSHYLPDFIRNVWPANST